MKELLERVLRELPGYLPDLASLVTRPKTTLTRLLDAAAGDLTRPLVFVSVSVAIGFLLQLPMLGKEHDFATLVAGMAVFKVLALIGFAGIIHGIFVAFGGKAPFATTFSFYLYAVSPLYIALVILEIASLGILRGHDPALATAIRIDPNLPFEQPQRLDAFRAAAPGHAVAYDFLLYGRLVVLLGWVAACWGALRQVHGVSRWRGRATAIVVLVAWLGFVTAFEFVLLGMFGSRVPMLR